MVLLAYMKRAHGLPLARPEWKTQCRKFWHEYEQVCFVKNMWRFSALSSNKSRREVSFFKIQMFSLQNVTETVVQVLAAALFSLYTGFSTGMTSHDFRASCFPTC